jgi:lambda repressor-like predicted transcriptional regulator
MPCTICQHPKRPDIDQALIAGSVTLAALSQKYGLSTSALHRHKAHLEAKVSRAQAQLQDNLRQGYIFQLSQFLEMAMQTAQAAQAEGNSRLVLQALAQGTRLINILLKQDLQLDHRVVYEILASPQWASQTSLLPDDPQVLAVSRQTLAGALAAPCPENEPESASAISPEDLDRLQENLLTLAQAAGQPKKDNRLSQKWEKGGKLPGYSFGFDKIYEEYQRILEEEKITGTNKSTAAQGR